MLTDEQGRIIVSISRQTLENFVKNKKFELQNYQDDFLKVKKGVFVTLNKIVNDEKILRGCIGFPYPIEPLGIGIQKATVAAASEDPRFEPVSTEELNEIQIEVSILTIPEEIVVDDRKKLPEKIIIGKDGLIVSSPYNSGLLLPQVAKEYNMDQETFLAEACLKAGLPPDSWLLKNVRVFKFQAEIFSEIKPRGEIIRIS